MHKTQQPINRPTGPAKLPRGLVGLLLWVLLSGFLLSACQDDSDCSSANSTTLLVTFLDSATGGSTSLSFDSIYAPTISTTVLNDTTPIIGVGLFIDPFTETTQYIFVRDTVVDSLTVTYSLRSRIITPSCGAEQVVTNLAVDSTQTTFDSAVVVTDFLNEFNETNIRLYIAQ